MKKIIMLLLACSLTSCDTPFEGIMRSMLDQAKQNGFRSQVVATDQGAVWQMGTLKEVWFRSTPDAPLGQTGLVGLTIDVYWSDSTRGTPGR